LVCTQVRQALQHTATVSAWSPYLMAAWFIRAVQMVCTLRRLAPYVVSEACAFAEVHRVWQSRAVRV
jgi:hypothetical protein